MHIPTKKQGSLLQSQRVSNCWEWLADTLLLWHSSSWLILAHILVQLPSSSASQSSFLKKSSSLFRQIQAANITQRLWLAEKNRYASVEMPDQLTRCCVVHNPLLQQGIRIPQVKKSVAGLLLRLHSLVQSNLRLTWTKLPNAVVALKMVLLCAEVGTLSARSGIPGFGPEVRFHEYSGPDSTPYSYIQALHHGMRPI